MANGFEPDLTPPGTAPMPLGKPAPPPNKRIASQKRAPTARRQPHAKRQMGRKGR